MQGFVDGRIYTVANVHHTVCDMLCKKACAKNMQGWGGVTVPTAAL